MSYGIDVSSLVNQVVNQVNAELPARAQAASQKLRNAAQQVLRGQRNGRVYRITGGGRYRASAPGEPPAVRTGTLRRSWRAVTHGTNGINPAIETNVPYAGYLEHGTSRMAPRPFEERIIKLAKPEIVAIYSKPFNTP